MIQEELEEVRITRGSYSDEPEWFVEFDYGIHYYNIEFFRCAHAVDDICPRVIRVHNEGGYNCTHLCLDCVLDAEKAGKFY